MAGCCKSYLASKALFVGTNTVKLAEGSERVAVRPAAVWREAVRLGRGDESSGAFSEMCNTEKKRF